jgi:signal recognition particle GTPase
MASRFTDRLWEIGDIVRLVEAWEAEQDKKAA